MMLKKPMIALELTFSLVPPAEPGGGVGTTNESRRGPEVEKVGQEPSGSVC